MASETNSAGGRRSFLIAAGGLAAAPVAAYANGQASTSHAAAAASSSGSAPARRKLGKLEVSSIGLGVQNMSRTYQTTVPNRAEMRNIIHAAFDQGVTLYDAADQALAPAVVQLANTDPTESTTITRRMRDLALLAQTSDVWQVCKSALRTIHAYEHLQQDGKKSG